jgi:PBP1b-binding outer membrane lipoprotein LpoB
MTRTEWKRKKREELEAQKKETKAKPIQKINNSFIENVIHDSNVTALKTVWYLSSILEDFDTTKDMVTVTIDLRKMLNYTNLNAQDIRENFKNMQKTSITFINEEEEWEEHITLIPRVEFVWGKKIIHIDIYSKIAKLIIDVKKRYTLLNTSELMKLKKKHSLRLLPILKMIQSNNEETKQKKTYVLDEFNELFGTNYKNLTDIERNILLPAKEELESHKIQSFKHEINFDNLGKGRPKAISITIEPIVLTP